MSAETERLVLDTSALFSMEDLPQGAEVYVTPSVLEELEKYKDRRIERWGELLRTSEATKASIKKVKEAAQSTGDIARVSPTDVEVLALAMDLGAMLLTDDYSIQNLAAYLGVPYRPVGLKGIRKVFKWKYKCVGCGRVFDTEMPECPVCGSKLRTVRSRKD
ncbi:MAG: nucleic acid-binding protein [Methanomassiliicoccales archaeon]|nr:nucleic acid-binding protein [Methanomassiliicoccales archaeon]